MSMNQVKYRHLKKIIRKDSVMLGSSQRQSRIDQIRDYMRAKEDKLLCPPSIKELRRMHRCWSSKVTCQNLEPHVLKILYRHADLQREAMKIFNTITRPA